MPDLGLLFLLAEWFCQERAKSLEPVDETSWVNCIHVHMVVVKDAATPCAACKAILPVDEYAFVCSKCAPITEMYHESCWKGIKRPTCTGCGCHLVGA